MIESVATFGGALAVSWATAVSLVSSVAIYRSLSARPAAPAAAERLRVLMVRPCAGDEASLDSTLRSVASARCSAQLSVRLTVADEGDAARPRTLEAADWLRQQGLDAQAVVAPPDGPNHKIGQLAAVADPAGDRYDIVLVVDSDVDLSGIDLDGLVAPVGDPTSGVAASWCAPVERRSPATLGDRASAAVLGGSLQAFVLLGGLDADGLVGKTFAVRTDALADIGGFAALRRHLGEDMEMARRLRARGWRTTMVPQPVPSLASGRSLRSVMGRYARWLMVVRAQRARLLLSYPLLLAATPLVLVLAALLAPFAPGFAAAAVAIALGGRLAVAHTAAWRAGRAYTPGRALFDTLLADVVLLAAFARALGPARVRWRQRTLRLGEGGLLLGEAQH